MGGEQPQIGQAHLLQHQTNADAADPADEAAQEHHARPQHDRDSDEDADLDLGQEQHHAQRLKE